MKIQFRDLVALLLLLGGGFLIYKGIDSFVTAIMTAIIGYYFSKRIYEERRRK